nr:hypothetical protein [Tanacetum cinerariifolium]
MHTDSQGKKQQVEDHRRNFKFSNNKTSVTACNDSLNAKTSNVNFVYVTCGKCVLNGNHDMCVLHYINGMNSRTKMPMVLRISTRKPKRTVNQSAATPLKRTVAIESTNQKPKRTIRKQYDQLSKSCKWWYSKFTPSGYKWKPKSPIGNVNINVSMPLGNTSRTDNILKPLTPRQHDKSELIGAAYDESYGPLQHPEVSLVQPSSNELFQAPHNPPCLEHLINGLDHGRCSVLITFSPDCLWQILHPSPFQTIIKSSTNIVERPIVNL